MVAQHLYRVGERTRMEKGKVDAFIQGELVKQMPYSIEVVISNPTSQARNIKVLKLLPEGAIPLANSLSSDASLLSLAAYSTRVLTVSFYFPEAGPLSARAQGEENQIVAWAENSEITVLDTPTNDDTNSWEWVSQYADAEVVMSWLKERNLHSLNLERIVWRMQDPDFYRQCINILKTKQIYHNSLWAYAFKHDDVSGISDYLSRQEHFLKACGPYIEVLW